MSTSPKFVTLVADPPWQYDDPVNAQNVRRSEEAGYVASTKRRGRGRVGAAGHYPTMTVEAMFSLPVYNLATAHAHLYLWCTNAFIEDAHRVARAWGFKPNTVLTWIKPGLGMGYHFRNTTEHVLFAVRGSLRTLRRNVPTHFEAPRGRHSEKPERFSEIVESMSPGPYLELFARSRRHGWAAWGHEIKSDVEVAS